ncbi:MAG: hypothetical protein ACJA2M_002876, partial [Polaribacter sp.]
MIVINKRSAKNLSYFLLDEKPELFLLLFGDDFLKEALFLLKSFFVGALFLFGF